MNKSRLYIVLSFAIILCFVAISANADNTASDAHDLSGFEIYATYNFLFESYIQARMYDEVFDYIEAIMKALDPVGSKNSSDVKMAFAL